MASQLAQYEGGRDERQQGYCTHATHQGAAKFVRDLLIVAAMRACDHWLFHLLSNVIARLKTEWNLELVTSVGLELPASRLIHNKVRLPRSASAFSRDRFRYVHAFQRYNEIRMTDYIQKMLCCE